jgi:hypothetical protein
MPIEYSGCPAGSALHLQGKVSPQGSVATYIGSEVIYSNGVFTITTSGRVSLTIKDGMATTPDGVIYDTGSGEVVFRPVVVVPIATPETDSVTATSKSETATATTQTVTPIDASADNVSVVKTETGSVTTLVYTAIVRAETGTATTTTNTTVVLTKSDAGTATKTVTTQIAKTVTESGAIITKTTQSFGTESTVSTTATAVAVTGSTKAVIAEVKEVIAPQKTSEVKALTDLLSTVSSKVEKTIVKTVKLPEKTPTTESAMSLTPAMCSVSGLVVTSLKKGLCKVAYTVTGSSNIPFTIEKTFNFTK